MYVIYIYDIRTNIVGNLVKILKKVLDANAGTTQAWGGARDPDQEAHRRSVEKPFVAIILWKSLMEW